MLGLVSNDELLYAVCPDGFPGEACQVAQRRSRAFAKTPANHRVNMFWVKQCRVDRTFYPPQKSSLFMPIPHALPLPGFGRVVVVISGFGDGFRRAVVHTVDVMGGTYASTMWMTQCKTASCVNGSRSGCMPKLNLGATGCGQDVYAFSTV